MPRKTNPKKTAAPKKPKKTKKKAGKPKYFTFSNAEGVKYEVLFRKPDERIYDGADGYCTDPSEEKPQIHINPYLTKQSELNTIIHEFTHAFFWDKTENQVYKFANALSRFLYTECGWRKLESKRKTLYRGK